ncbi:serine/threonine protein kinase [Breznakia sp. PF5-3]|uniref:serine/threonine-protein kinase n=1 Tax=unclassified Breznakia TaxID=2623764 RepID=UPI002404C5A1|nr:MULTISPECIES: serine/threonine-protein kinase [unclassified Breznakia]MDF9825776.1 serine/threonine protein kinase [Breznakia sp. PM6-1]MDF9836581.1 serine/threonine protein kinase [Breznakia sp. PF5-3]MDF9838809.1 serine/threonine protein kinase [Breznakia sp. PFB2-8]MDF9860835.1 serine/threonine protein kinase [Breznakia sp. PH5-24]
MEKTYILKDTLLDSEFKRIEVVESKEKRFVRKQFFQHENRDIYERLKYLPIDHFPKIYEINEIVGGFEVIEEYLDGQTLRETIPLSFNEVIADYAIQIVDALAQLHKHKIVHRDLKPENIIVVKNIVKIIDFDIAKKISIDKSRDTRILGSVGYAAPEQYGFASSNEKSDIYAFGNILNEMCTGSLASVDLTITRFRSIVLKCTKIDPDFRYSNLQKLRNDLMMIKQNKSKYTLPGFRTNNGFHMLVGTLSYLFLIFIIAFIENTGDTTLSEMIVTKVEVIYMLGLTVIFVTNYLDVDRFNFFKRFRLIGKVFIWFTMLLGGIFVIMSIANILT